MTAIKPTRGRPRRPCGLCPHYGGNGRPQGWCPVKAVWTAAKSPACDYGLKLITRASETKATQAQTKGKTT